MIRNHHHHHHHHNNYSIQVYSTRIYHRLVGFTILFLYTRICKHIYIERERERERDVYECKEKREEEKDRKKGENN